jgi:hypothetical protein
VTITVSASSLGEALVVVQQRARVGEADFHLARFREIVAVRLQDLHDLLAHQRLLYAVELGHARSLRSVRGGGETHAGQQRQATKQHAGECRRHAPAI